MRRRRNPLIRFLRWFFNRPNQSFAVVGVLFCLAMLAWQKLPVLSATWESFAGESRPDPIVVVSSGGLTGRASVIDGDTIEIQGQRIRLTGIDSPEGDQTCQRDGTNYRCGQVAANALADLIDSKTVVCVDHGQDRYKRVLATCRIGATDLGRWMVLNGHALAFRRYSTEYIGDEDQARVAQAGIWSGSFIPPWEFRAGKRQ